MFDTAQFFGVFLAFVLGTGLAKGTQAWVAMLLGDRLPRNEGRQSLKPNSHMTLLGFIVALFLSLGLLIVPWGKPLNFNPIANRLGRKGVMLVGLVGPIILMTLGIIVSLLLDVIFKNETQPDSFGLLNVKDFGLVFAIFREFAYFSILLGFLNLLPIYPLDGYFIFVKGLFPARWELKLLWLETYGIALLMFLFLILPFVLGGFNPLFAVLNYFTGLIISLFGFQSQMPI